MDITIKRTSLTEVDMLLTIQKKAFAEDYKLYEDHDTTPVNETPEKLVENIENAIHYTILSNNNIIGAIDLRKKDNMILLDKLFIANEYQNKGLGTKIMKLIEAEFALIKVWRLYTPYLNKRNQYFYEKFGYEKIGEVQLSEKLLLFKYEKCM
ncbi:GNAT family N-acetyltransferase [Peribacillus muralis]|uniref:GNAT family N-acetyltransferase n=1 Tax=Peribacillus muralis TaxID=264697 RepID=UPI00070AA844|nr:GNAT family N-acetyltransferase [Peribacillus muralis]